jgi:hypothetical protein
MFADVFFLLINLHMPFSTDLWLLTSLSHSCFKIQVTFYTKCIFTEYVFIIDNRYVYICETLILIHRFINVFLYMYLDPMIN